jgi:hypothetical protein
MIDTTVETETPLGEVIVTATPQTSYDSYYAQVVYIKEDGTVGTYGSNEYGQRNVEGWNHIVAVAAGADFNAGLREDGIVLVAGSLTDSDEVEYWTDIVAIASDGYDLFGLTSDGNIVFAGYLPNRNDEPLNRYWENWKGIKSIACGNSFKFLVGLGYDGNIYANEDITYFKNISGWQDVECITVSGAAIGGIKTDGTVVVKNCGDEEINNVMNMGLSDFRDIIQIYITNDRVIGVSADGTLYMNEDVGVLKLNTQLLHMANDWNNLRGIVAYGGYIDTHLIGFQKDGHLLHSDVQYGDTELEDMTNLSKVVVMEDGDVYGNTIIAGIKNDGGISIYSSDDNFDINVFGGIYEPSEMNFLLVKDSYGVHSGAYYLTEAGRLYLSQTTDNREYYYEEQEGLYKHASAPKNKISNSDVTSFVVAVTEEGNVKIIGNEGYEPPDEIYRAEEWVGITQTVCINLNVYSEFSTCVVGLKSDGTLVSVLPEGWKKLESETENMKGVVSIYGGFKCMGVILQDGTAAFLKYNATDDYGQFNTLTWTDLTQLAMGEHHTVGLKSDGTVYACGSNLDGQCDVSDWTDIVYIEAGKNFTLGVKADGTLLVAGSVG